MSHAPPSAGEEVVKLQTPRKYEVERRRREAKSGAVGSGTRGPPIGGECGMVPCTLAALHPLSTSDFLGVWSFLLLAPTLELEIPAV